jgi:hypothetical protein
MVMPECGMPGQSMRWTGASECLGNIFKSPAQGEKSGRRGGV